MRKEHRELRRRPLLTPLWVLVLIAGAILAAGSLFLSRMTTTTVVLVRHAEKEIGTIEDSPLSTAGEQRALALARLFGERAGSQTLAAVFASETRRTQSTAAPLAARLKLPVSVVPARDSAELLRRIHREYRGRNVLVVGHGNTIPELARQLSRVQEIPAMPENDYSTIYIVTLPTLGRPSLLQMSY